MHSGRVSHHCTPCSEILREKMASEVVFTISAESMSSQRNGATQQLVFCLIDSPLCVCVFVYIFFPTHYLLVIFLGTEMPSFLKTPMDLTIRTGAMARLECAAEGHPAPQISWQKDGGTDFPAARERRMHVMPEDDVFFIANVKIEDMGIYSCMAQNIAGGLSANASLIVLGMFTASWIHMFVGVLLLWINSSS